MENNKRIPKLRFPEFKESGEWEEKALGEVGDMIKGKGISKSDIQEQGNLPCIRYGELYTHYSEVITDIRSCTNLDLKGLVLSKKNDVIIPSSGETQEDIATASCVQVNDVALGGDLNVIRAKCTNGIFLSYSLNGVMKAQIANVAQGISVVHLYIAQLKTLTINIPSLPEQQKISSCLSSLDDLISSHTKKLELLKEHKKGLMQNLFPKDGQKVPDYRFPEFKESGEWVEKTLGEVCDYWNGTSNEKNVIENGQYFLISLNSIDIEGNLKKDMKRISYTDNSLQKGDLVMILSDVAHGDFLGLTAIIPDDNYVLNQRVGGLRVFNVQSINRDYLRLYINGRQKYFKGQGQGSSQQNLSKSSVLNLPLLIPSIIEQQKISNCLSSLDTHIEAEAERIEQLKQHKKGLMQGLFPKMN